LGGVVRGTCERRGKRQGERKFSVRGGKRNGGGGSPRKTMARGVVASFLYSHKGGVGALFNNPRKERGREEVALLRILPRGRKRARIFLLSYLKRKKKEEIFWVRGKVATTDLNKIAPRKG